MAYTLSPVIVLPAADNGDSVKAIVLKALGDAYVPDSGLIALSEFTQISPVIQFDQPDDNSARGFAQAILYNIVNAFPTVQHPFEAMLTGGDLGVGAVIQV